MMKSRVQLIVMLLVGFILSACQVGRINPSKLIFTLHQDVVVPAKSSQVYIQYGEVKTLSGVNENQPYCRLYAPRPKHTTELTIAADLFEVRRVYRRKHLVALKSYPVASSVSGIHDLSKLTLSTHFELFSPRQPLVKELICSRWADPLPWNYLRAVEIDDTLGMLGTIASQH